MRLAVYEEAGIPRNSVKLYQLKNGMKLPTRFQFAGREMTVEAIRVFDKSPAASQFSNADICVGCGHAVVDYLQLPEHVLSLQENGKVWRLGPCLGLYAERFANPLRMFGEQTKLFEDLTERSGEVGLDVVVFTPNSFKAGQAWRYIPRKEQWQSVAIQNVDIVLRRSGTFRKEFTQQVTTDMRYFKQKGVLHTLPRDCSNKWKLYQTLRQDKILKSYLPYTALAESGKEVYEKIINRKDVYVKPIGGAQGISVFRLKAADGAVLASWEKRKVSRVTERISTKFEPRTAIRTETFSSFPQFQQFWQRTGLRRCIVQDTVQLPRILDNQPYDFRWLVQSSDVPIVVARVARIGQPNAVTTNIHTGGMARDASALLEEVKYIKPQALLRKMDEVALSVARRLADKHGHFAELGVDLAIAENRQIYIFEVNPTPGRRMLRSLSDNVREMSLQMLLEYAMRATGFARE